MNESGRHAPEPRDPVTPEAADCSPTAYPRPAGSPHNSYEDPWLRGEQPRRRRSSPTLKAVAITLSVLVLIIASALVFMDDNPELPFDPGDLPLPGGDSHFHFSWDTREEPSVDEYESYQEYFDRYYEEAVTESGGNSIPRAGTAPALTLSLLETPDAGTLSLQEIYAKCSPAIVSVSAYVSESSYHWGTGIVMTADGYILTNAHILDGTGSVTVALGDGTEYEALLVGDDARSDLAVLKIEAHDLICAEFGDSDLLQVGDQVAAIGNPLGEEFRGTMTDGIISAINRDIDYNGHTMTLLQTNAALNEGNSGGALVNMYGQVVGITNMKMISSFTSVEGLGFAIPTRQMKPVIDSLLANGAMLGRPAIGITVGKAIPESAKTYFDLPDGAYVTHVHPNSDAWAQGLRPGDIITAVNGVIIRSSDAITEAKAPLSVGDGMTLTVFRSGESFDIHVRLVDSNDVSS